MNNYDIGMIMIRRAFVVLCENTTTAAREKHQP